MAKRTLRRVFAIQFVSDHQMSTAVDISPPMKEVSGQRFLPACLALLWEITITKQAWKEPLSII